MTFGELEVGDRFITAKEYYDELSAYEKKSGSSGYDLIGGEGGTLERKGNSVTTKFSKSAKVYKLEAEEPEPEVESEEED